MKIIVAKRSGLDGVAYINADKINSWLAEENKYDKRVETRIYFAEGRCEIEGDQTQRILDFLMTDDNSGVLDLTTDQKKSWWNKEHK